MILEKKSEMDEELFIEYLKTECGFIYVKYVEGRGYCGLKNYLFTIGLVYGIDSYGFSGRWCYAKNLLDFALKAFFTWDGVDDPFGPWIKYKGDGGERENPKYHTFFR